MFDLIPDMAAKRADLSPDARAFCTDARSWTFAEVDRAAAGLASGLTGLGLAPGDRLGVLMLNAPEFFVTLFACQKARVIMVPLNWRLTMPELQNAVQSIGMQAVLFDAQNRAKGLALAQSINARSIAASSDLGTDTGADADLAALMAAPPLPPALVDAADPWYLLFTSGTTGTPKAVIQTGRMAWANALNVAHAIDLTSADTSVN